jgi:hypothetical protein
MIEAVRSAKGAPAKSKAMPETKALAQLVDGFAETVPEQHAAWKKRLAGWKQQGHKVVLWGSGSKAVSFLTTLGITDELQFVVDINPHRQGMFMPGTGHSIVSPDFLTDYKPDRVIIMNPIYREEIAGMLKERGVEPAISTVVDPA